MVKNKIKVERKQISGAFKLIGQSLRLIKANFKSLGKIVLISVFVSSMLQLLLTSDVSSLYQSLWFVFSSCALIWVIRHFSDKQVKLTARGAYYDGTAPALKYFLVTCIVAISTLPFSLGIFIFLTVSNLALGALGPIIIAGVVWALLALASVVLLSRWIFALPIVTLPQMRPIESLRISWALTKGQVRSIIVRLGIVLLLMAVLAAVAVVLISVASLSNTVGLMVLGVLSNGIAVPFFYTYLFQLYHELT